MHVVSEPCLPLPSPDPRECRLEFHIGALLMETNAPYQLEIEPHERHFNRLQWYPISLRFTDPQGRPAFVGHSVTCDEQSTFYDMRRKQAPPPTQASITLSLSGLCSDLYAPLVKCTKCQKRDRSLLMSKRKGVEANERWSEEDERSNERLVQATHAGTAHEISMVHSDGVAVLKVRIACCVGVVKQHHVNHVGESGVVMHKGCSGISIQATASIVGLPPIRAHSQPVRVVGKVAAADKKATFDIVPLKQEVVSAEENANRTERSANAPSNTPHELSGHFYVAQLHENEASSTLEFIWTWLEEQGGHASSLLFSYVSEYRSFGHALTYTPVPLYSEAYWTRERLALIAANSPIALVIYTVLGSCAPSRLASLLWFHALPLSDRLCSSWDPDALPLLVDALTRVAAHWGALYDRERARSVAMKAEQFHDRLPPTSEQFVPLKASVLWVRAVFGADLHSLMSMWTWAEQAKAWHAQSIVVLAINLSAVAPIEHADDYYTIPHTRIQWKREQERDLLQWLAYLKTAQRSVALPSHYDLVHHCLGALYAWLSGDSLAVVDSIRDAALYASVLTQPVTHALFVPLFLAAYVALSLHEMDPNRMAAASEHFLRQLVHVHAMRWTRPLLELLVARFKTINTNAASALIQVLNTPL